MRETNQESPVGTPPKTRAGRRAGRGRGGGNNRSPDRQQGEAAVSRAYWSRSPAETRKLAARLARRLQPGTVVALFGGLGSGKTCFVQGLAAALGVRGPVASPSFTFVHEYAGRVPLYHMDLYRLGGAEDLNDLDWDEYLEGRGITVVEWAERARDRLPRTCVRVRLEPGCQPNERRVTIECPGP